MQSLSKWLSTKGPSKVHPISVIHVPQCPGSRASVHNVFCSGQGEYGWEGKRPSMTLLSETSYPLLDRTTLHITVHYSSRLLPRAFALSFDTPGILLCQFWCTDYVSLGYHFLRESHGLSFPHLALDMNDYHDFFTSITLSKYTDYIVKYVSLIAT